MKKKLWILPLIALLALAMTACSSQEEEDPEAQKATISGLDNTVVEDYLNQYNLDAENTISAEDLTATDDDNDSFTCTIDGLDVALVTDDDDLLAISVTTSDLDNEKLDVVARDLIIGMDSQITHKEVAKMLKSFRDGSETSYDFGVVRAKLEKTSAGSQIRIYSVVEDMESDYDSAGEALDDLDDMLNDTLNEATEKDD